MAIQRRLVALVIADVVGYPRLIERDDVSTHERLRKLKTEVIDPEIAEPGGRIIKTTGDGILVGFSSVTSALHCAVEIQREMGVRNLYVAPDDKSQFRIAINLRDIIVEGDDILGGDINVAARLETLSEPGGICVASAVWDRCTRTSVSSSSTPARSASRTSASRSGYSGWRSGRATRRRYLRHQ